VTRRELDVLEAVVAGLTNAEIASRLCISERTVESHISSLLHKLGARNRVDLAGLARSRGPKPRLGDEFPRLFDAVTERGLCVGRDEERERLLECWERSATRTTVAVLRGEAGIGKSRLAAEVAVEAHRRGGGVALGICTDGPQRPYEPFMAAIEADLGGLSHEELARQLETSGVTLARLSPDVATRLDVVGQEVVAPEREQLLVLDALLAYLSTAARSRRLLFVIEDLHWASVGTRDAVAHIARAGGAAPLMLLVTTRDEAPFIDSAFGAFLGRLTRLPSVDVVALSGLDVGAAAALIESVDGELDPEEGVRQTGGNPLFLHELAREGPGSRSLRELVADRFNRLSATDRDVLDVAAVAGEQIDASLLASALDRSVDDVLDTLERAETAGLIGPGARQGCLAFTHDLYRSVRYASLATSRRFRLHAALALTLRHRADDGQVTAELARHACLAGPRFDPATAADLARQAGDAAADATDHSEAAAHYRRALEALDSVSDSDDGARLELSIRLGASLHLLGDEHGLAMLQTAARTARQRGDPVSLAKAVCAMEPIPGSTPSVGRADEKFRSLADAALGMLSPQEEAWRIRVSALLGMHLFGSGVREGGTEMIRTAVAAARRLGDPVTLGRALLSYRFCGRPGDTDQRLACGHELIELGDRTGLELFACVGRQQLWWCHRELGNRDEMDHWYQAAAEHVHGPDLEQLSHAAAVALMEGDLARAEQLTGVIEDIWESNDQGSVYAVSLRSALNDWRERTSDLDAVERQLAADGSDFAEIVEPHQACGRARRGQVTRAHEMLDHARRRGFPPMYAGWGGAMGVGFWAETAAIVRDAAAAEELGTLLEPLAGRLVDGGVVVWDTVDRLRALLRMTTGDPAAAADIAAGAVAASRQRRTPVFLGRELIALVAAIQTLGIDAAETTHALSEALTIARLTGARMIAKDAELFLTAPVPALGPEDQLGLTAREREILVLVADGATNTQIATTLGVSPATVRKHLEHAYAKLHVSTRTAAAARIRAGNAIRTQPSE
jgi:DNA-binding NarL/FixJ family response regulator